MANSPSHDTNSTAGRTIAAGSAFLTGILDPAAAEVAQPSIRSITPVSEEEAQSKVVGQLMVFGGGTKGATQPTNGTYLGSSYYELRPLVPMNSLPQGFTLLRLADQRTEAYDDFAGASISANGILRHRDGSVLGTAYISTQKTLIAQIPRWQQED